MSPSGLGDMSWFSGLPIWAVALVLSAIAPFCVRRLADLLEHRTRLRTARTIAQADTVGAGGDASVSAEGEGRPKVDGADIERP